MIESLLYPYSFLDFDNNIYLKKISKLNSIKLLDKINFTWDNINKILNTRKIDYNNLFLYKNNNYINPKSHFDILKNLSEFYDILIPNINFYTKEFKYLKVALEDQTKCNIDIDLYIKSPIFNVNNLLINKEFFVLVLDGNLKLKVGDNIFELNRGECLYIPQYLKYMSIISDNQSIISLIKLEPNNAYKFFNWFLNEKITKYDDFYNIIEINSEDNNELFLSENSKKSLETINKKFLDVLQEKNILNEYYSYLIKNQEGLNTYSFPDIYINKKIDKIDNLIFLREEHQSVVFDYENNFITIYFWKKKLSFPKEYKNILELIFSKNIINSEEIIFSNNSELKEELILNLLNKLISIGILKYKINI